MATVAAIRAAEIDATFVLLQTTFPPPEAVAVQEAEHWWLGYGYRVDTVQWYDVGGHLGEYAVYPPRFSHKRQPH